MMAVKDAIYVLPDVCEEGNSCIVHSGGHQGNKEKVSPPYKGASDPSIS